MAARFGIEKPSNARLDVSVKMLEAQSSCILGSRLRNRGHVTVRSPRETSDGRPSCYGTPHLARSFPMADAASVRAQNRLALRDVCTLHSTDARRPARPARPRTLLVEPREQLTPLVRMLTFDGTGDALIAAGRSLGSVNFGADGGRPNIMQQGSMRERRKFGVRDARSIKALYAGGKSLLR